MCINSAPAAAANRNSSSIGGKERKRHTRRESWREAQEQKLQRAALFLAEKNNEGVIQRGGGGHDSSETITEERRCIVSQSSSRLCSPCSWGLNTPLPSSLQSQKRMSVSGKKEFDVKQILRLRWRWFSHSSQGSAGGGGGGGSGGGGYIQQDGLDHRGTPVQGRLKSHSRERGIGGLRKTNSPAHSVTPQTPGPTQVYVRTGHQSWHHLPNTIQGLQVNEETPKSISSPSSARKEETNSGQKDVTSSTEEPAEVDARDRYGLRANLAYKKSVCFQQIIINNKISDFYLLFMEVVFLLNFKVTVHLLIKKNLMAKVGS